MLYCISNPDIFRMTFSLAFHRDEHPFTFFAYNWPESWDKKVGKKASCCENIISWKGCHNYKFIVFISLSFLYMFHLVQENTGLTNNFLSEIGYLSQQFCTWHFALSIQGRNEWFWRIKINSNVHNILPICTTHVHNYKCFCRMQMLIGNSGKWAIRCKGRRGKTVLYSMHVVTSSHWYCLLHP